VTGETRAEREARLALEGLCADVGRRIGGALPSGVGFALLLFDFGGPGNFAYVSNGQRDDMVKFLAEARDKIRGS
jgi:hypothetical protein